jgi:hypothetical protein
MNADDQKQFITELSNNIVRDLRQKIDEGKVPEDWDGHELRVLLAESFEASASMSLLRQYPRRKRMRNYRNTVRVNNL